jgi:hypothetical protein
MWQNGKWAHLLWLTAYSPWWFMNSMPGLLLLQAHQVLCLLCDVCGGFWGFWAPHRTCGKWRGRDGAAHMLRPSGALLDVMRAVAMGLLGSSPHLGKMASIHKHVTTIRCFA